MSKTDRKNELLYRVYFILLLFIVFAAAIAWRIITISVIEGDKWIGKKEKNYMEWRVIPTLRGSIYADDEQSLLATSVEFFDIRMDPTVVKASDFQNGITALSEALSQYPGGKTAREWKDYISSGRKNNKKYLLIAKKVDHFGLEKLKEYPIFDIGGSYKSGMIKIPEFVRKKPFVGLAARSLGEYRDKGMVGLENRFDKILRGEEKKAFVQKLPGNLYVPVYDPTDYEIIEGEDLVTTLNVPLQDIVHNELLKSVNEHNAEAGVAILMEVETGRIKAISNLSRNKAGSIGEFQNMAIAMRSEPGSTMKAASVLALLEDGLAAPETVVDFSYGKKKFWDQWMKDSSPHGMSKGSLRQAFEKSSNVAIGSVMQENYGSKKDRIKYYDKLMQFGFDAPTGIEIEGEMGPYIKHPIKDKSKWYGTTIPWMAHGYELSMTPLQILNFYNAIANNGRLMQPQLVSKIKSNEKLVKEFKPVVFKERIANAENIKTIQELMAGVVTNGTGKSLKSTLYDFSGKTGTTVVGYNSDDESYNASFAGYWPSESPKYSMIVVVYGLKGSKYYGNVVAGPVFKRIMDWTYAIDNGQFVDHDKVDDDLKVIKTSLYSGEVFGFADDFGILFDDLDVDFRKAGRWIKGANREDGSVVSVGAKITKSKMPDLSGMGARDAIYVVENLGMTVKLEGTGKVVKQSLNPGKNIDNQAIILYLN